MKAFITELIDKLPFDAVGDRSWLELVSILAPSVLFICVLYSVSFLIREKDLKISIYVLCVVLTLIFLPYELFRQASNISKVNENISITQNQLKELLTTAELDHLEPLVDKKVASELLGDLIYDISDEQKQSLIYTGWLIAENASRANQHIAGKYQSLNEEIKLGLDDVTKEIISSRTPTDKISEDILTRIDHDVSQLIDQKMVSFNQEIDQSMGNFQERINSFIQNQLDEYEKMLAEITQKNAEDLENFSGRARIAFATQVSRSSRASLKKLEDTKKSIDEVVTELTSANLRNLTDNVKQLSALMEETKKKNDILFKYNECVRLVGMIDFSGKEEQCRKEMKNSLAKL